MLFNYISCRKSKNRSGLHFEYQGKFPDCDFFFCSVRETAWLQVCALQHVAGVELIYFR